MKLPSSAALLLVAATLSRSVFAQDIVFENATSGSGLGYPLAPHTPGASVGDFDGDGWLDVCICGAADPTPQFFRNLGSGSPSAPGRGGVAWNPLDSADGSPSGPRFKKVTSEVMLAPAIPASLAQFADMDNDGDADLVVVERVAGNHRHTRIVFYENEGGVYTTLHQGDDLGFATNPLGGLGLADFDRDGDLDVVFAHNGGGNGFGGPGFYLFNQGFPNFVDQTWLFGGGMGIPRRYWSVAIADFMGNGRPDLHAAIDGGPDFHCHGLADGTLVDVSQSVGTNNIGSDMGLAVGDPDLDGDLDVYSTNIQYGVLYVNDGQGNFTNLASQRGCAGFGTLETSIGWGTAFVDFDLDGDEDLCAVAAGHPGPLFANDGTGNFTNVTDDSGLVLSGLGLIPFDYDRDGDIDLITVTSSAAQTLQLWRNVSPRAGRHWLVIDPYGRAAEAGAGGSNRDGVGARIEVTVGGVTMIREILASSSFKSGIPTEAHFGLGTALQPESVRITWPSGVVQELGRLAGDRVHQIREP